MATDWQVVGLYHFAPIFMEYSSLTHWRYGMTSPILHVSFFASVCSFLPRLLHTERFLVRSAWLRLIVFECDRCGEWAAGYRHDYCTALMRWMIDWWRCQLPMCDDMLIVRGVAKCDEMETNSFAFLLVHSVEQSAIYCTSRWQWQWICSRLKTHLFRRCFPWHPYCCRAREVTVSFRTR